MKIIYDNTLLAFMILSLSACTVGPDYVAPHEPDVMSYTGEDHIKFTKTISKKWWETFQSPELNQVIQLGIKNNYSFAAMKETLKQAQNTVTATKGQLQPQVSANAGPGYEKYGVQATGATDEIPAFHYYTLGPSINWALDLFGATKRGLEQQQALMRYQQQEVNAAFLTLTGNIVTTTLKIAEINAQIISLQSMIQQDKKNIHLIEKGLMAGAFREEELLIAKSQLNHDETLLPSAQQQLSNAQGELNILVGAFPANWQAPAFTLKNFTLPKTLPLTLPSQLVHDRPDILAAESLLHAASAGVGVATANLYPQINLSASLSQQALSPGQLFSASSTAASVFAGLTAPIFSGGTLQAEKRAAEHAYKAAYAHYQDVVVRAFVQVSDVLHALKHDNQNITAQENALKTAEDSLQLALRGHAIGSGNELAVIKAEHAYNEIKLAYTQAIAQRYQDTVRLYLVLGGGISNTDNNSHLTSAS